MTSNYELQDGPEIMIQGRTPQGRPIRKIKRILFWLLLNTLIVSTGSISCSHFIGTYE